MSKFIKEVEEAIAWFATEFKYLKRLHSALEKIRSERGSQQKKDLKIALKVARYIGKAERRAEKPLKDILEVLGRIQDTTLHRTLKNMEIPERKLVRDGSMYLGSLRKELKTARRSISIYESYPSKSLEQKIQVEISKLNVEVEELETWVAALERGLQIVEEWLQKKVPGITRRKLIKATAAGAGLALSSPLGALAGTDVAEKIRKLPIKIEEEYLKKYLGEKGTYDYAKSMSQITLPASQKFSMYGIQTLWHYKRDANFFKELLALGFSKNDILHYSMNYSATNKWLVDYAKGLMSIKVEGNVFFTPSPVDGIAQHRTPVSDIKELVKLFNHPAKVEKYIRFGGTAEYAKALQEQGLDADTIYRSCVYGQKVSVAGKFKDTKRPNAVIVVANEKADHNGAVGPVNMKKIITSIMSAYDVLIKIATSVQDLQDAIDLVYNAGGKDNFKLLAIAGHGSPTTLSLGSGAKITTSTNLKEQLNKLAEDARIFLVSCKTGKGGNIQMNLANHIVKQAADLKHGVDSRIVFAAEDSVATKGIKIDSVYPLEVRMFGKYFINEKGEKELFGGGFIKVMRQLSKSPKFFMEDITYRATLTQGVWLMGS